MVGANFTSVLLTVQWYYVLNVYNVSKCIFVITEKYFDNQQKKCKGKVRPRTDHEDPEGE
jgi:hypothetical protein